MSNQPSQSFAAALEQQRQLMHKRLESWTYLKRVYAADQSTLWFNTVALSRQDIEGQLTKPGSPSSGMLQKRTLRFMVLGLNLSPLLDQSSSADFFKGLLSLSQDFDQLSDDSLLKPRMVRTASSLVCLCGDSDCVRLWRRNPSSSLARGMSGRGQARPALSAPPKASQTMQPRISTARILCALQSPSFKTRPFAHLVFHMKPFDLDYFQTFFTLADIFVEIYAKILSYIGPAPSSPNPSLSQSRSNAHVPPMSPANLTVPQSQSQSQQQSSSSSSSSLSPPMVDIISKIDAKLRKVPNAILKELDGLARQCIRDELAGLDQALCGANGGSTPDALLRRGTMSDE